MANGVHTYFPHKDFKHFVESTKPWLKRTATNPPPDIKDISDAKFPNQLWFHVLRKLVKKFKYDIDPEHLQIGRPSLGLFPHKNMLNLKESPPGGEDTLPQ